MNQLMSSDRLTMSSLEIAKLCDKEHRNVNADIKKMICELDANTADFSAVYKADNGQEYNCYNLPRRECDILIAGYSVKYRAAIVDRWHELEKKDRLLNPPMSYADSLRAYADAVEAKEKAELELDAAVKTKAEIGHRREATAMNTASQAVKKVNALSIELDKASDWSTIKRMEKLTGLKFNWRLLKSAGQDLDIQAIDVFDANYGTTKAYYKDVWLEAYALDIKQ